MYRPEVQLAAATFGKSLRLLSAGGLRRMTRQMQSEVAKGFGDKASFGRESFEAYRRALDAKGRAKRLSVIDGGPFATAARS
jgi:hypothetical protein